MAQNSQPIASGVVLPDLQELDQNDLQRAPKRRQSTTSDLSTKRLRLSTEGSSESPGTLRTSPRASPTLQENHQKESASGKERRQSNLQEERKRGQRLFGGLLNTLSQSASNNQQKRRQEIEKRQQEKARLQKAEDESRRADRLQKLKEVRLREQVKFDLESMRIRHSNLLAMAHFLRTKAEPKLYYKPWELLPGDAERIKDQIMDCEAAIEREVREFKERHKHDLPPEKPAATIDNGASVETVGEHQVELSSISPAAVVLDSTNSISQTETSKPAPVIADPGDENGEVLVEGDEDTVIY